MSKQARLAELVIRPNGQDVLLIDGEEFPYHILQDGLQLVSNEDGPSMVLVAIPVQDLLARYDTSEPEVEPEPVVEPEPAPEPEKVQGLSNGDVLVLDSRHRYAPQHAWAFRHPDDVNNLPYLIRNGQGDSWVWKDYIPENRSDTIGWAHEFAWADVVSLFQGTKLVVERAG